MQFQRRLPMDEKRDGRERSQHDSSDCIAWRLFRKKARRVPIRNIHVDLPREKDFIARRGTGAGTRLLFARLLLPIFAPKYRMLVNKLFNRG